MHPAVKELTTSKKIIVAVVLTGAVVLGVVVDTLVRSRAHKEALHAAE